MMDADGGKEWAEIQQNLLEVGIGWQKWGGREEGGWRKGLRKRRLGCDQMYKYLWICFLLLQQ